MSDLNERAARLMGFHEFRPGHWHAPDASIYGTGNVTFGTHWNPDTDPTQCETVVAAAVAAKGGYAFWTALMYLCPPEEQHDGAEWLALAGCAARLRAAVNCLEGK